MKTRMFITLAACTLLLSPGQAASPPCCDGRAAQSSASCGWAGSNQTMDPWVGYCQEQALWRSHWQGWLAALYAKDHGGQCNCAPGCSAGTTCRSSGPATPSTGKNVPDMDGPSLAPLPPAPLSEVDIAPAEPVTTRPPETRDDVHAPPIPPLPPEETRPGNQRPPRNPIPSALGDPQDEAPKSSRRRADETLAERSEPNVLPISYYIDAK